MLDSGTTRKQTAQNAEQPVFGMNPILGRWQVQTLDYAETNCIEFKGNHTAAVIGRLVLWVSRYENKPSECLEACSLVLVGMGPSVWKNRRIEIQARRRDSRYRRVGLTRRLELLALSRSFWIKICTCMILFSKFKQWLLTDQLSEARRWTKLDNWSLMWYSHKALIESSGPSAWPLS